MPVPDGFWDDLYNRPGQPIKMIDPPAPKPKEAKAEPRSDEEANAIVDAIQRQSTHKFTEEQRQEYFNKVKQGDYNIQLPSAVPEGFWDDLHKPATPVLPEKKADETGVTESDVYGNFTPQFVQEGLAAAWHGAQALFNEAKMDSATRDLQEANAGRTFRLSPRGTPIPLPTKEEAAAKWAEADAAATALSQERNRYEASLPKSEARQKFEQDLAQSKGKGGALEAYVKNLPQAARQLAVGAIGFAPTELAGLVNPYLGATVGAAQVSGDTAQAARNEYLTSKGINPEDIEARKAFFTNNPDEIDKIQHYVNIKTSFMAGAMLAGGPIANKVAGVLPLMANPLRTSLARAAVSAPVNAATMVAGDVGGAAAAGGPMPSDQQIIGDIVMGAGFDLIGRARGHSGVVAEHKVADARARSLADQITEKVYGKKEQPEVTQPEVTPQEEFNPNVNEPYSAERKAAEEEAGFRTIERQKMADTLGQKYPVTGEVKPVTPEEVQAEWQSQKDAEDARLQRVEMGQLGEELRNRQRVAEEKAKAKAESDAAARTKAEADHRRKLADQVVAENPGADEPTLIKAFQQKLADNPFTWDPNAKKGRKGRGAKPAPIATPTEARAKPEPPKRKGFVRVYHWGVKGDGEGTRYVTTARSRAEGYRDTGELYYLDIPESDPRVTPDYPEQSAAKGATFNFELSPEEAKGLTKIESPRANPVETKSTGVDKELDDIVNKLNISREDGLDMANDTPEANVSREEFRAKTHDIVKKLIYRNSGKTNAVINLMQQGKLVVAPNGEAIGRPQDKGAASYSPEDGKMYMYTDKMDSNPASSIIRAVHESTHAGQFNDREGRSSLLRQIMGADYGKAHEAIMNAYGKNKLATEAVDKALAAAKQKTAHLTGEERVKAAERIANLEVVPYFVGAAEKANKGFGRLGALVRSIEAKGRDFVRENVGLNLDVNLSDIASANEKILKEIGATDLKGNKAGESLDMIGGTQGKGYKEAEAKGFAYPGAVDKKPRYEFSDEKAKLNDSIATKEELSSYRPMPIKDVIEHSEFAKNYPGEDSKLLVAVSPDLKGTNAHYVEPYKGSAPLIEISEDLLWPNMQKELRSVLLHEMQHHVQYLEGHVKGANMASFMPKTVVDAYRSSREVQKRLIDKFDLGAAERTLPPDLKKEWETKKAAFEGAPSWTLSDTGTGGPTGTSVRENMVKAFIREKYGDFVKDAEARRQAQQLKAIADRVNKTTLDYNKARAEAYQTYLRDYGETEARNTQHRADWTDEQRKAAMPESTMVEAHAKVPVEKTLDTRPLAKEGKAAPMSETKDILAEEDLSKLSDLDLGRAWAELHKSEPYYSRNTPEAKERRAKYIKEMTRREAEAKAEAGNDIPDGLDMADEKPSASENKKDFKLTDKLYKKYADEEQRIITAHDLNGKRIGSLSYSIGGNTAPAVGVNEAWRRKGVATAMYELANSKGANLGTAEKEIGTGNNRTEAGKAFRQGLAEKGVLDMATPDEEKKPLSLRVPSWVMGLVDSAQGAGAKVKEIVEAATSSPSGQRMISEGLVGRYRQGLAQLAAERGVTTEQLNKEIASRLEAIDTKSDSYEQNLAAFKRAVAPYGEAGKALLEMRNQSDSLSIQMLKARADLVEKGQPLTPDEKKVYATIRNNLGRYSHRQYAVHLGKIGRSYAEGILKDYSEYKAKNGDNVSPEVKANYEKVAKVVKKIIDEQLVIPDNETLANLPAEQVHSLFDTWGGATNPKSYTLDEMKSRLADIRDAVNGNKDLMRSTAEAIVKEILDVNPPTSLVTNYYRGGKINKGILMERSQIAPEVRELMGEIKDPEMRMFVTVAKQVEFIARNRMLNEIRELNDPNHIQPPGSPGRPEVKDMVKLESDAFGPLQNHYVSKNLYNVLSDHVQQLANFEQAVAMAASRNDVLAQLAASKMIKAWGNIAGTAKMLQIIYKPANFLYNFMGGPRTLLVHGNVNPKYLGTALETARDIVHYSINPTSNSALARRVTEAGITDSAFNGEIRGELFQELNKTVRNMRGKSENEITQALRKAMEVGHKAKTVTNETYAMMDVTYKIANFLQMADHLTDYYKAEGVKKTAQEIDREAADITNRTNVTYKRAAPIVRAAERYGITNFGTFFYEVFRSEIGNVRQGFEELRRAKTSKTEEGAAMMRAQGTKRLLGQLTAWILTGMASRALASIAFGDDKEKEQKLRDMLVDYEQSKDFLPVGKDKDGKPILFDVSRIDPVGPATDIMRSVLNRDANLDEIEDNIFQLYVAPRIGVKALAALSTTFGGENKRPPSPVIQQLAPNSYENLLTISNSLGVPDRITKAWTNVAETFLPGVVSSWKPNAPRPLPEDFGSTMALATSYAGGNMYKADPIAAAKEASFNYSDVMKYNRKTVTEMFADNPNITPDQVVGRLDDMKSAEEEQFVKLQHVYEGMKATGMTSRQISVALKNSKVPVEVIHDLKSGEFRFRSVSQDSIKQYRSAEIKAANTPEEKQAVKDRWHNIWVMLKAAKKEVTDEDNE